MSISQVQNFQSLDTLYKTMGSGHSTNQPLRLAPSASVFSPDIFQPAFETPLLAPVMPTFPMVRVGNLWLPRESLADISRMSTSQSPLSIARNAVARGISHMKTCQPQELTQHAMMIPFGEFATSISPE